MSDTLPKEEKDEKKPKLVKVEALRDLNEDGEHRKPGDTFEVTPERFAALGSAFVKKA